MNVAVYARTASASEAEKSINVQIEEMEEYCRVKGLTIVRVFREPGASGRDENRPAFQAMIFEATKSSHPFDVILTTTSCRFFRDLIHALAYKHQLEKSAVKVVAIKQEVSDPMGKIIEGIFELIAQCESEINTLHAPKGTGAPPITGTTTQED